MCRESLVGHLNAKFLLRQIGNSSEINFFTASRRNVFLVWEELENVSSVPGFSNENDLGHP
jgi:hypothetical protein